MGFTHSEPFFRAATREELPVRRDHLSVSDLTPYFATGADLNFVGSYPVAIGIGFGGQIAERAMRTDSIVVKPPSLYFGAGLLERKEQIFVQAFVAALAIEAFDKGILYRFACPNELQLALPVV